MREVLARLTLLALCACLASACSARPGQTRTGTAAPAPLAAPVSPLVAAPAQAPQPVWDTPVPMPTPLAAVTVTCTPAGDYVHCTDPMLDLAFDYPAFLPAITGAELRPGSYGGVAYEYAIDRQDYLPAAGGRSWDFGEGRGGMYTDFPGRGDPSAQGFCTAWRAARCDEIKPGVTLALLLPRAAYRCSDAMPLAYTPTAVVLVGLAAHPTIQGFAVAGPLLPPADQLTNPVPGLAVDPAIQACPAKQQAAYDAWMDQLAADLGAGAAEPAVQARWDAFVHLAQSVDGVYVNSIAPPRPTSTQTPAPASPRYGIPTVDAVIAAVAAEDRARLQQLLHWVSLGCRTEAALGGPPPCRPGEVAGTSVEVIPLLASEGVFLRADEQNGWLDALFALPPSLAGVYPIADPQTLELGWLPATHALIFWRSGQLDAMAAPQPALILFVDESGIVRVVMVPDASMLAGIGDLFLTPQTQP